MTKPNLETNMQIADLLGWEHIKEQDGAYEQRRYEYALPRRHTYYTLYDGDEVAFEGVDLPDWYGDAELALALITTQFQLDGYQLSPDAPADSIPPRYFMKIMDGGKMWTALGATAAEAICKAWLNWKTTKPD